MTVTFLGTATSSGLPVVGCSCRVCRSTNPRNHRFRASVLMEWDGARVVVDTGPEFRLQMVRAGVRQLDAVLVTHEHADHIFGLDDVRPFTERRGAALPVFAAPRTAAVIRSVFPYIFQPPKVAGTTIPLLDLIAVEAPFELMGRTVRPVTVSHGRLPIYAYRVGGFAYATDTSALSEEAEEQLRGVHTLVLGALRHRPHPTHFTLNQAMEAARRIGPRRTYFTHIGHDLDHDETNAALPNGFALAYDGLTITVPDA